MNRKQRHYRKANPRVASGYETTYCGLPIVADCARITNGEWQPAYFSAWAPSDILEIPLCHECHNANVAERAPFTCIGFDPR